MKWLRKLEKLFFEQPGLSLGALAVVALAAALRQAGPAWLPLAALQAGLVIALGLSVLR